MALSDATKRRIKKRVEEFVNDRKLVQVRIREYIEEHEEYTNEYKNASVMDIQEHLQHLFVPNAKIKKENEERGIQTKKVPKFTRFIWKEEDKKKPPLWQRGDVAIVIGKVIPTGSDFIGAMEKSDVWREKLKNCRVPPEQENPPYCYTIEVFKAVMDFYEEGSMQTFFIPPNGNPKTEDDRDEIKNLWEETKKSL